MKAPNTPKGWAAPPAHTYHRCVGVTVFRLDGMRFEQITVPCIEHDEHGNHLARLPDGQTRWSPA